MNCEINNFDNGYQARILNLFVLFSQFENLKDTITIIYHEDLQKRGGVWCCGTREPCVTIRSLLPKENIFSNLPAFQDLNGTLNLPQRIT